MYYIANIHCSQRHPGVIYAELWVESPEETFPVIGATLDYILDAIKERKHEVKNLTFDKWGNWHINPRDYGHSH